MLASGSVGCRRRGTSDQKYGGRAACAYLGLGLKAVRLDRRLLLKGGRLHDVNAVVRNGRFVHDHIATEAVMTGKIERIVEKDGHGFIAGDDGQDYIFQRSALPEGEPFD